MKGAYTIDPNGGDFDPDRNFKSISEAVDSLEQRGIDSIVVLNIADGTYDERLNITAIPGVSASDTVIFQSASADSNKVFLDYTGFSSTYRTMVSLSGCSYVTFKHISFVTTQGNGGYGRAIGLFSACNHIKTTQSLEYFPSDTLLVSMTDNPGIEGFKDSWYFSYDDSWYMISGSKNYYGKIELDIEPADSDNYLITVNRESQGRSRTEASINSDNLEYNWDQNDTELILDPYFSLRKPNRWRAPLTEVTVHVPQGKYIRLDRNTRFFLDDVKSAGDEWDHKLAGQVWQMTEAGLTTVEQ